MNRIVAILLVCLIALAPAGCKSGTIPAGPLVDPMQKLMTDYVRMIDEHEPGTDEQGKRWAKTRKALATETLELVEVAAKGGAL